VADYLLLAALSRALGPCPKTQLAQWYQGTILPRLLPIPPQHLSSQRFWDHFDYLDADTLRRLEEALSLRLAQPARTPAGRRAAACWCILAPSGLDGPRFGGRGCPQLARAPPRAASIPSWPKHDAWLPLLPTRARG
jgi:hypothetical protein